jgi:hypothetical protein
MASVKILCHCGQRYSFDVEPVDGRMPSAIACPSCGADGTKAANEVLSKTGPQSGTKLYVAKRSGTPSLPVEPSPTEFVAPGTGYKPAFLDSGTEQKRGRLILLGAFCPLVLCQMLVVFVVLALRLEPPGKHLVRVLLHSAFMVGTYFGMVWAKRLLLVASILGVIDSGGDLLTKPSWISAFVLMVVAPIPLVLLFSKSVNSFLDYQGRER